jgi:hypothetical protein
MSVINQRGLNQNNLVRFNALASYGRTLNMHKSDLVGKKKREEGYVRTANRIGQGDKAGERRIKEISDELVGVNFSIKQNKQEREQVIKEQGDQIKRDRANIKNLKNAVANKTVHPSVKTIAQRKVKAAEVQLQETVTQHVSFRKQNRKIFGK